MAESLTPVVNVVLPQPLNVTLAILPNVKVGRTNAMESPVCTSGTFSANVNEMAVGASVDGVAMVSTLCWNAGVVGTTTAVDVVIWAALASFACASTTAAVRVARLAFCAMGLVVTPDPIVTLHRVSASISALAAVSLIFADAVPVALAVAVKVVLPHPTIDGVGIVPRVKVGRMRSTLSVCFSGAFSSNAYEMEDLAIGAGLAIVSVL